MSLRLTFVYDFNQLYLYDAARERSPEGNEYLDALDAATEAGLTVGARSGVVDLLMPRRENFAATIDVRVLPSAPPLRSDADHIVEFDLVLSSGRLVLEGSGDQEPQRSMSRPVSIAHGSREITSTRRSPGAMKTQETRPTFTCSTCGRLTRPRPQRSYNAGQATSPGRK